MSEHWIALCLALVAPIALIAVARARRQTTLNWTVRSAFWLIASVCFLLVAASSGALGAARSVGLLSITDATVGVAALLIVCLFAAAGLLSVVQRLLGLPLGDHATFVEITSTPIPLRIFVVLTAGIVEEFLYRGIGIGVGMAVLGNSALAGFVSTFAFVAAHFRWRTSHLIQVALGGAILSVGFVLSRDLWACIIAHTTVDAIGFLLMPALLARRSIMTHRAGAS